MLRRFSACAALLTLACGGTTGGELVEFQAAASGPAEAAEGQPLSFENSKGWQVDLTTARLHIGALYFVDSSAVSGAQSSNCLLPGSYVAQVRQGLDVDLLSGKPQLFPGLGRGTTTEALAGQVWLTGGDVNLVDDPPRPTVILQLAGNAMQGADVRPFDAALTIAGNRISSGSGTAGASTICKQRIVSRTVSLFIQNQGALLLRIDPRRLFTNVDFSALEADGNRYSFKDDSSDQPSANLYNNLTQGGDLYSFSWQPTLD